MPNSKQKFYTPKGLQGKLPQLTEDQNLAIANLILTERQFVPYFHHTDEDKLSFGYQLKTNFVDYLPLFYRMGAYFEEKGKTLQSQASAPRGYRTFSMSHLSYEQITSHSTEQVDHL